LLEAPMQYLSIIIHPREAQAGLRPAVPETIGRLCRASHDDRS
jgi:hypothetical protein